MPRKALCPEERVLSYSKYFDLPIEPPDPVAEQVWRAGPVDPSSALRIENIDDLFKPGYLSCELGYCIMDDGVGFIANYVRMNRVTEEMVDWWFTWHFIAPPGVPKGHGNLRYKIWNPDEHWDTGPVGAESYARRVDRSIPYRLRKAGATDFIEESLVGGEMLYIEAFPVTLEDIGADHDLVTAPGFGTYVAATTSTRKNANACSVVVHYYRPAPGGMELRSRYWYGYKVVGGKVVKDLSVKPSLEMMRDGCMHNMVEYPRLGRFLPDLWAEEGWKPVDAY